MLYIEIFNIDVYDCAILTLSNLDGHIFAKYELNKPFNKFDITHLPKEKLKVSLETDYKMEVKLLEAVL